MLLVYSNLWNVISSSLHWSITDPLGNSAPDVPALYKLSLVEVKSSDPVTLICSAQASPAPSYRCAFSVICKIIIIILILHFLIRKFLAYSRFFFFSSTYIISILWSHRFIILWYFISLWVSNTFQSWILRQRY